MTELKQFPIHRSYFCIINYSSSLGITRSGMKFSKKTTRMPDFLSSAQSHDQKNKIRHFRFLGLKSSEKLSLCFSKKHRANSPINRITQAESLKLLKYENFAPCSKYNSYPICNLSLIDIPLGEIMYVLKIILTSSKLYSLGETQFHNFYVNEAGKIKIHLTRPTSYPSDCKKGQSNEEVLIAAALKFLTVMFPLALDDFGKYFQRCALHSKNSINIKMLLSMMNTYLCCSRLVMPSSISAETLKKVRNIASLEKTISPRYKMLRIQAQPAKLFHKKLKSLGSFNENSTFSFSNVSPRQQDLHFLCENPQQLSQQSRLPKKTSTPTHKNTYFQNCKIDCNAKQGWPMLIAIRESLIGKKEKEERNSIDSIADKLFSSLILLQ